LRVERVKSPDFYRLNVALKNMDGKVGKVGWFEKSKYNDDDATQVAMVAAQNEYGNPNQHIPARPFMRPTIAAKQNEWKSIVKHGAEQILNNNYTITNVLDLLGQKAAGDVREKISKITTPPLSSKTIEARLAKRKDKNTVGNLTKPLIDTGYMLNSLSNTVEDA